ncbi:hypothetical protein M3027_10295 [Geoalkalibacter halelectricus]|nr:hypothetical protein [Geoalkalibacter halelectricus]MDO3378512.1 hypothetical protein [Geoalkalibacter halelectricus]
MTVADAPGRTGVFKDIHQLQIATDDIAALVIGTLSEKGVSSGSSMALTADSLARGALQVDRVNNVSKIARGCVQLSRSVAGFARHTNVGHKQVLEMITVTINILLFCIAPGFRVEAGGVTANAAFLPGAEFTVVVATRSRCGTGQTDFDEQEVVACPLGIPKVIASHPVDNLVAGSDRLCNQGTIYWAAVIVHRIALLARSADDDSDILRCMQIRCQV